VRFVVDKVTYGQVFLQALRFSLSVSFHQCSIIIHALLLTEGQGRSSLGTFKKSILSFHFMSTNKIWKTPKKVEPESALANEIIRTDP
jgi:hypothetical protein